MDEEDLIKRTKNSLSIGKSRAEILRGFQGKGYKLEYAEKILKKASLPRKVLTSLFVSLAILVLIATTVFITRSILMESPRPVMITGLAVAVDDGPIVNDIPDFQSSENLSLEEKVELAKNPINEKMAEKRIDSDTITKVLYDLDAKSLRSAPFYGAPIMNFKIDKRNFSSTVSKDVITTIPSLSKSSDLEFTTTNLEILRAFESPNPKDSFRNSVASGATIVEIKASNTELFAKGYLSFYESLN